MSALRHRIRILLVDGDATVQHLRGLMLRMKGYSVDHAGTLGEARLRLSEHKYHLVIVDVGHFADPGFQFCEEIKKVDPQQKVLMQAQDRVFPAKSDCPDKIIPIQEGPHRFVTEVEQLLQLA